VNRLQLQLLRLVLARSEWAAMDCEEGNEHAYCYMCLADVTYEPKDATLPRAEWEWHHVYEHAEGCMLVKALDLVDNALV
jgi:hypothetical protein